VIRSVDGVERLMLDLLWQLAPVTDEAFTLIWQAVKDAELGSTCIPPPNWRPLRTGLAFVQAADGSAAWVMKVRYEQKSVM
jgi:hypothetical protein